MNCKFIVLSLISNIARKLLCDFTARKSKPYKFDVTVSELLRVNVKV
jgi:hypothetical protein